MIPPGSRYEGAEHQFTQTHTYNQFGFPYLEGDEPNLKIKVVNRETLYLLAVQADPALLQSQQEYFVKDSEDIQWLSFKFLRDPNVWWQFAEANPHIWYPLDMTMGDYIHVPPNQPAP